MRLSWGRLIRGSAWTSASGERLTLKDHRLIAIKKNAILDMPANCAGEYDFLEVAALADEILDGIAMRNADDILFNDGTIVQNFGDVMAGCPDQLHPALERLMVRPSADERGQKRMVNIDDA